MYDPTLARLTPSKHKANNEDAVKIFVIYYTLYRLKQDDFTATLGADEYSCMRILDMVCHFYLFSIPTNILNTFFLPRTKVTTTPVIDRLCINCIVPSLLVHLNIILRTLRTQKQLCYFLDSEKK